MELIIFPLLHSKSRKLLLQTKKKYGAKWGHPYNYEPNGRLLERLSVKLQMTKTEVREKLMKEREYLLAHSSK